MKNLFLLFVLLGVTACASSPLKLDGVSTNISPAMASDDHSYSGKRVVWGGMIINTQPLQHITKIEVLAYPVNSYGEPDQQGASQGRFIIQQPGFLEPADYAAGRWISVVGTIGPSQVGTVGKASYRFPVIIAEQLYMWPQNTGSDTRTFFHFGVGIQL